MRASDSPTIRQNNSQTSSTKRKNDEPSSTITKRTFKVSECEPVQACCDCDPARRELNAIKCGIQRSLNHIEADQAKFFKDVNEQLQKLSSDMNHFRAVLTLMAATRSNQPVSSTSQMPRLDNHLSSSNTSASSHMQHQDLQSSSSNDRGSQDFEPLHNRVVNYRILRDYMEKDPGAIIIRNDNMHRRLHEYLYYTVRETENMSWPPNLNLELYHHARMYVGSSVYLRGKTVYSNRELKSNEVIGVYLGNLTRNNKFDPYKFFNHDGFYINGKPTQTRITSPTCYINGNCWEDDEISNVEMDYLGIIYVKWGKTIPDRGELFMDYPYDYDWKILYYDLIIRAVQILYLITYFRRDWRDEIKQLYKTITQLGKTRIHRYGCYKCEAIRAIYNMVDPDTPYNSNSIAIIAGDNFRSWITRVSLSEGIRLFFEQTKVGNPKLTHWQWTPQLWNERVYFLDTFQPVPDNADVSDLDD